MDGLSRGSEACLPKRVQPRIDLDQFHFCRLGLLSVARHFISSSTERAFASPFLSFLCAILPHKTFLISP
jgi:hypothetical protein